MTRQEAERKAQIIDFQGGYTIELVHTIYASIFTYLDKAMSDATTLEVNSAYQKVKDYLEVEV